MNGMKRVLAGGVRMEPGLRGGFSIIELMAATAVLSVMLFVIFSITQQVSGAWRQTNSRIEAFQGARGAFAAMTQQIGQATLNTYYDYYNDDCYRRTTTNAGTFIPARYGRFSDLHFICARQGAEALVPSDLTEQLTHALFFQAPLGSTDDQDYAHMPTLLNACGYFIAYGEDATRPEFLDDSIPNAPPERYRFRLMQFLQPSQDLRVYDPLLSTQTAWFRSPLSASNPPIHVMAENIIALVFLPRYSTSDLYDYNQLTSNYCYDSRDADRADTYHQLPPLMEVVMVAVDEESMVRMNLDETVPNLGFNYSDVFQSVDDQGENIDEDLETITGALSEEQIKFRVFRSIIPLRASKWTTM